jgi:hypothetical protein
MPRRARRPGASTCTRVQTAGGFTFTGETAGEGFGTSPSVAGDVDGDGFADLIVGAWQYSREAAGGGRAYLYSGKDGRLIKTYTCRIPGDTFGFDAVTLSDVDGDHVADFLITSAWSGVNGFHSGACSSSRAGCVELEAPVLKRRSGDQENRFSFRNTHRLLSS